MKSTVEQEKSISRRLWMAIKWIWQDMLYLSLKQIVARAYHQETNIAIFLPGGDFMCFFCIFVVQYWISVLFFLNCNRKLMVQRKQIWIRKSVLLTKSRIESNQMAWFRFKMYIAPYLFLLEMNTIGMARSIHLGSRTRDEYETKVELLFHGTVFPSRCVQQQFLFFYDSVWNLFNTSTLRVKQNISHIK